MPRAGKFTNRLRYLRTRGKFEDGLWLTQKEVAKLLDLDIATVSRHENGDRSLDETDIIDYANLYKVQSYEIFIPPPEPQKIESVGEDIEDLIQVEIQET